MRGMPGGPEGQRDACGKPLEGLAVQEVRWVALVAWPDLVNVNIVQCASQDYPEVLWDVLREDVVVIEDDDMIRAPFKNVDAGKANSRRTVMSEALRKVRTIRAL